ncbi:MAG: Crp/Fnr family transcriptional regulator [Desulfobacterales bacterium]|nr:Crp/Fnr family transcriptional regulator [Desulfobacterales bacterium]
MKKNEEIISGVPLFSGLPEDQRRDLSQIAVNKNYQKGEVIFSEGDTGSGFYIIAAGQVKVFKVSSEGKEQILHIFGPGEPIGEVPVFTGQTFPAYAEALAKSHLLFFPRPAFVELIAGNPSLALNILAVLSMRLRQFTVQIENLSLKEVPGRLASYLIYLSGEQENRQSVKLNISKGQLASLLGTIPETLSRIFAKMSEQGLIAVNGRQIRLLDSSGLESLATHGKN